MLSLEERIRKLPPSLQKEVLDFVEFLEERKTKKLQTKLQQDWAGALKDYRSKYTSIELQKKALEWRGD